MSNVIQIKHGSTKEGASGKLASYELGFIDSTKELIIGDKDGAVTGIKVAEAEALAIKAGKNQIFAGPSTGLNGTTSTPSFRALVVTDIPNLPHSIITGTATGALYLNSKGGTAQCGILPITYGGIGTNNTVKNQVFAGPTNEDGSPSFRMLVANDIPNLSTSKITSGTLPLIRGGTGISAETKEDLLLALGAASAEDLTELSLNISGAKGKAYRIGKLVVCIGSFDAQYASWGAKTKVILPYRYNEIPTVIVEQVFSSEHISTLIEGMTIDNNGTKITNDDLKGNFYTYVTAGNDTAETRLCHYLAIGPAAT